MRRVVRPGRSLRLFRLAIFVTIPIAAAGCSSDTHRFDSASYRPSAEVTGSVPQRHVAVRSQPLPPPSAAPRTRPAAPAPVAAAPVQTASAARDWSWNGGTAIVVRKGDTIDGLVARYGVPASVIAEANNLPNGSALRPGQRLVIP
jgi:LysM repeat protein